MSDIMRPMSFAQLLDWTLTEYKKYGTVFGARHAYRADEKYARSIFGRTLETPIGPAAGPHTQLAQNLVAAYYTGSRFFELKTVQVMDGAELSACVNKPCIKADDECYNCEWSTELYVPQAMEEYIKAWFLCKIAAKEFGLGSMDGFQFNISVGYDLAGIQSEKIDNFLNTMKHAQDSEIFKSCRGTARPYDRGKLPLLHGKTGVVDCFYETFTFSVIFYKPFCCQNIHSCFSFSSFLLVILIFKQGLLTNFLQYCVLYSADGTVTMEVQGREALINKLLVGLNGGHFISIEWMDTKEIPLEEEREFVVKM